MADEDALVRAERRGEALVVTIETDRFDSGNAQAIQAAIEAALRETPAPAVAVDLGGVEVLTSAGMGTLIALHSRLRAANRRLAVCGARSEAAAALRVARLERVFEVVPSVSDFLLRLRTTQTRPQSQGRQA